MNPDLFRVYFCPVFVEASLLAMAVGQAPGCRMYRPHRGQARSHRELRCWQILCSP